MPWRTRAEEYQKRENAFYAKLVREAVSGKAAGMNTCAGSIYSHVKFILTLLLCRWAAEFAREDKPEGDQSRFMNQFAGVSQIPLLYSKHPTKVSLIK